MIIQDGRAGYTAQVDDENALLTNAITNTNQFHANHNHQTAYTMDIDGVQTADAAHWLAVIKITDDDDLIITSITGWVPSFSNTQIYEAVIGGTFTYASNGTAVVPTNLNTRSGHSPTGLFYVNDGVGNMTTVGDGSIAGRYIFTTTPTKWEKATGWIIPKNQCFAIRSDLGEKLTGYISFYYHNSQRT